MEVLDATDPHADLRRQVYELKAKLNHLETEVYRLLDAFYAHTHEEFAEPPERDCDS